MGCSSVSQERFCHQDLYEFDESVQAQVQGFQDRGLAAIKSLDGDLEIERLGSVKDWSYSRLKQVQSVIDRAEYFPNEVNLKRRLHQNANDLVQIYGYAEAGNAFSVKKRLEQISERNVAIGKDFCEQNSKNQSPIFPAVDLSNKDKPVESRDTQRDR